MNPDGSDKRRVTFFNAPQRTTRVIVAENGCNASGTEMVSTADVIAAGHSTTKVVLLEFRGAE